MTKLRVLSDCVWAMTVRKAFPSCAVPRCDNPAGEGGLCRKHFDEHRDNGAAS